MCGEARSRWNLGLTQNLCVRVSQEDGRRMFSYECDFLEAKESGKLPVLLVPGGLLVGFDDLQRRATYFQKGTLLLEGTHF